jgi:hypothetical protein
MDFTAQAIMILIRCACTQPMARYQWKGTRINNPILGPHFYHGSGSEQLGKRK